MFVKLRWPFFCNGKHLQKFYFTGNKHFTKILPGVTKARVHSRIIMAPQHSKAFLSALKDNIARYENEHGKIVSPEQDGFGDYPLKPSDDNLPN